MSTFKEIRGQLIKSLSSDPSPAAAGDIFRISNVKQKNIMVLVGLNKII